MTDLMNNNLYDDIKNILNWSRKKAVKAVNSNMVEAYWNIGRLIVKFQGGKDSAEYGTSLLEELSTKLTKDYGAGFDKTNLRRMRKFYLIYKNRDTLCHELSWSHYRALLKIKNSQAREFYVEECIKSGWSVRELSRQINSFYFERLLASKDKESVIDNMLSSNADLNLQEVIKDPYILEFLGINKFEKLYEKDLEKQLINHLQ